MTNEALARLRLYQLITPSLPIGAFTYSQGLEWAIEQGWVEDQETLHAWLASVLHSGLESLELPLLLRLHRALEKNSLEEFAHWSEFLLSNRETRELRDEEQQRAHALIQILEKISLAEQWPEWSTHRQSLLMSQASGMALAAWRWSIPVVELMQAAAWSWLENAVMAAVKLVPLGQSDGQRVLYQLSSSIPDSVDKALGLNDDQLGASTLAMAIASSRHETQYTRLFRS